MTCTATSTSGITATCGFQVTVVDGEKPAFAQPLDIVRAVEQAQTFAAVDFQVTATDNCPGATTICLPPSGSAFPLGVSVVTCTATDAAQNRNSTTFTVGVGTRPEIVSRPGSQSVLVGQTAAFSVIADGAGPLLYQWKFNGVNLIDQTSDTLVIPNAQAANAGDYRVAVSNPFGSVLSGVATLRVLLPPAFNRQPADASVRLDSPVSFCAEATGTPPLQFQWRKSGVNIAGATESCYAIPKVRIEDGGQYSVIVTSEAGSVVSGTAQLTITELPNGPPAEDNFANRFELFGASGVVSVNNIGATKEAGEPDHAGKPGGSSVWYNWRAPAKGIATFRTSGSSFDTLLAAYSGTSVNSLSLLDGDEDRGGYLASEVRFNTQADALYQVAIDGYANSQGNFVLSWNFQATAEELPTITTQPRSQTVAKGAAALLEVVARGQDLNYQWSLNGAPLAGAVSSSLSIPQVKPADVGTYTVRVANGQRRTVDSQPAVLEIGAVNVQSQDKLEDLFLAPAPNPLAVRKASASAAGGVSVRAGTIGSHTLNNSSSTNSGRAEVNALCGLVGGERRWFNLRAEDGGILSIDTQGSAIDTLLGVFTLDFDGLLPVRCDDNGAPDARSSLVRFAAVSGTDYLIGVDGVGGETGVINLNWSLGVPLSVRQQGNALLLSWPASFVGFVLEENSALLENAKPPAWPRSPGVPTVVNGTNTLSLPLSGTTKFYRLRHP